MVKEKALKAGSFVSCEWGGQYFRAKVLDVRGGVTNEYLVHYHGWPKRYDEWVTLSRISQSGSKSSSKTPRKSVSPTKAASPSSSSKKRKTVDGEKDKETPSERRKFEYDLPKEVKRLVIHDWEEIQGKRIVSIPRKNGKTVSEVIGKEYASEVVEDSEARELLQGLVEMFDVALPVLLLYEEERPMYDSWHASVTKSKTKSRSVEPSDVYGLEHFVRLFVKLPNFMEHATLSPLAEDVIKEKLDNLLFWILKKSKDPEYFMVRYDTQLE